MITAITMRSVAEGFQDRDLASKGFDISKEVMQRISKINSVILFNSEAGVTFQLVRYNKDETQPYLFEIVDRVAASFRNRSFLVDVSQEETSFTLYINW